MKGNTELNVSSSIRSSSFQAARSYAGSLLNSGARTQVFKNVLSSLPLAAGFMGIPSMLLGGSIVNKIALVVFVFTSAIFCVKQMITFMKAWYRNIILYFFKGKIAIAKEKLSLYFNDLKKPKNILHASQLVAVQHKMSSFVLKIGLEDFFTDSINTFDQSFKKKFPKNTQGTEIVDYNVAVLNDLQSVLGWLTTKVNRDALGEGTLSSVPYVYQSFLTKGDLAVFSSFVELCKTHEFKKVFLDLPLEHKNVVLCVVAEMLSSHKEDSIVTIGGKAAKKEFLFAYEFIKSFGLTSKNIERDPVVIDSPSSVGNISFELQEKVRVQRKKESLLYQLAVSLANEGIKPGEDHITIDRKDAVYPVKVSLSTTSTINALLVKTLKPENDSYLIIDDEKQSVFKGKSVGGKLIFVNISNHAVPASGERIFMVDGDQYAMVDKKPPITVSESSIFKVSSPVLKWETLDKQFASPAFRDSFTTYIPLQEFYTALSGLATKIKEKTNNKKLEKIERIVSEIAKQGALVQAGFSFTSFKNLLDSDNKLEYLVQDPDSDPTIYIKTHDNSVSLKIHPNGLIDIFHAEGKLSVYQGSVIESPTNGFRVAQGLNGRVQSTPSVIGKVGEGCITECSAIDFVSPEDSLNNLDKYSPDFPPLVTPGVKLISTSKDSVFDDSNSDIMVHVDGVEKSVSTGKPTSVAEVGNDRKVTVTTKSGNKMTFKKREAWPLPVNIIFEDSKQKKSVCAQEDLIGIKERSVYMPTHIFLDELNKWMWETVSDGEVQEIAKSLKEEVGKRNLKGLTRIETYFVLLPSHDLNFEISAAVPVPVVTQVDSTGNVSLSGESFQFNDIIEANIPRLVEGCATSFTLFCGSLSALVLELTSATKGAESKLTIEQLESAFGKQLLQKEGNSEGYAGARRTLEYSKTLLKEIQLLKGTFDSFKGAEGNLSAGVLKNRILSLFQSTPGIQNTFLAVSGIIHASRRKQRDVQTVEKRDDDYYGGGDITPPPPMMF